MCSRVVIDDDTPVSEIPVYRKEVEKPLSNVDKNSSDRDIFPDTGGSMKDFQVASKQAAQVLRGA
jgi:hypothetical protein